MNAALVVTLMLGRKAYKGTLKTKHNAKDDETDDEKDITSPKSSDNSDKEHMDLDESGDDSTESESGDDSTESESG